MYGIVPPNPNLYKKGESGTPIHYGVAKAALIHLTKELAIRLSDKQVRVNSISYGGVETSDKNAESGTNGSDRR